MRYHITLAIAVLGTVFSAFSASAEDIRILDAFARSSSPNAMAGAAFMEIRNGGTTDDRLVAASSPMAKLVELHSHREDSSGVMRMIREKDGFPIPAGKSLHLKRGGLHIMFMGLVEPFDDGKNIPITLIFEKAGHLETAIPVDLNR
ncbi:MAG: copper chaperone PCu(A)C [Roseovarius sp.]|nr:copper chaperone PCu(A)C [Roseovarius sp.]